MPYSRGESPRTIIIIRCAFASLVMMAPHESRAFLQSSMVVNKKTFSIPSITTSFDLSRDDLNDSYDEGLLNNKKRTSIQHFLSQRSIQSFMTNLLEFKDPHTSDWIERFLDAPSLPAYHGTGALNMTRFESWDSYFLDMAKQPKERILVQARRNSASAFRGGSKNNPFLKKEREHLVEIPIDIYPSSLVPRILSVREQIAREMVVDVDIARRYNDQILSSYEYRVRNKGKMRIDCIFDRASAMMSLTNVMAMEKYKEIRECSSPLRKGTYDLLLLLSLHESIHCVLRGYKDSGDDKEVSFNWLRGYYTERVSEFFDGFQYYGRSEDFVEELLMIPPSVKNTDEGTTVVDTKKVASDIIKMRSDVLMSWRNIIEEVPNEHIGLRQCVLVQQAKGWAEDLASDTSTLSAEENLGAFQ